MPTWISRSVSLFIALQLLLSPVVMAANPTPTLTPAQVEENRRAEADRKSVAEADKAVETLAKDAATDVVEEVLFETLADLAGSSCTIYALGLDFSNFAWDGQWSFIYSLLDVTVLFRNQSWRELIWAVEDERKKLLEDLTKVKKQRCVLGFDKPKAGFEGREADRVAQQLQLERKVAELEGRLKYLGLQRRSIQWDAPYFDEITEPGFVGPPAPLQTDVVFYWLTGAPKMAWDQFARDTKSVLQRTGVAMRVAVEQIPDGCFAVMNIGHELYLRFVYSTTFDNADGTYSDDQGVKYKNFREYIEKNQAAIATHYDNKCKAGQAREVPPEDKLPAEEQYKKLLETMNKNIQETGKRLEDAEKALLDLEKKKTDGLTLTEAEEEQLKEKREMRGIYLGMIDYFSLVISKVGGSTSASLTDLKKSLSNFVEAVLGVQTDKDGKKKSRLSMAERFQASKERSLKNICGRLKSMYKEAGRNTSDLPTVGRAKGKSYCKVDPECEGVELANFEGGSEGRKKLAKCTGFQFDSSDIGLSQQETELIKQTSEDISTILSQRSLNDLLVTRNLHLTKLRNTYVGLYKAQTDTNGVLERMLQDIARELYTNEIYNPDRPDTDPLKAKSHYSMLKRVYDQFWIFADAQKGSCPAPQNPQG